MNDMPRITRQEVAKRIRREFKRHFPGVPVSVRSELATWSSAVRVRWVGGPTSIEVSDLFDHYRSGGFDGMIDMAYYRRHWLLPDGTVQLAGVNGTTGSCGVVRSFEVSRPKGAVSVDVDCHFLTFTRVSEGTYEKYGLNGWGEDRHA